MMTNAQVFGILLLLFSAVVGAIGLLDGAYFIKDGMEGTLSQAVCNSVKETSALPLTMASMSALCGLLTTHFYSKKFVRSPKWGFFGPLMLTALLVGFLTGTVNLGMYLLCGYKSYLLAVTAFEATPEIMTVICAGCFIGGLYIAEVAGFRMFDNSKNQ